LFRTEFWIWLGSQWQLLLPAFIGSLLLSVILAAIAYPTALWVVKKYKSAV